MSAHYNPFYKPPQQICTGFPCWCGHHSDEPPQGFHTYDKERTKQWLVDRQTQREKKNECKTN